MRERIKTIKAMAVIIILIQVLTVAIILIK